jgi:hypothetical protein
MGRPCRPSHHGGPKRVAVPSMAVHTAQTTSSARTPAKPAMVPQARTALPMRGGHDNGLGAFRCPLAV